MSRLSLLNYLSLLSQLSRRAGLAQFILIVFGCIYAGQDTQLLVNTPLIIHHSAYTTHHTPLVTHHSSYTTHHTPLSIHHSSYTTRHTPLIIHHSSYTPLVVAKKNPVRCCELLILQGAHTLHTWNPVGQKSGPRAFDWRTRMLERTWTLL